MAIKLYAKIVSGKIVGLQNMEESLIGGFKGHWVEGQEGNLPCSTCQNQTNSYQYLKFHCFECRHEELVRRKDKLVEDPQYCPICNP